MIQHSRLGLAGIVARRCSKGCQRGSRSSLANTVLGSAERANFKEFVTRSPFQTVVCMTAC